MGRNIATLLLKNIPKHIFKMLGRSKCEALSCVDFKDAFHKFRPQLETELRNSVVYPHILVVLTECMKLCL